MGSDSEGERQSTSQDDMRVSKSSMDPILNVSNLNSALTNVPYIASMNVNKSTGVHIGPKVVSITQNVQNTEGMKEMPCPRYLWTLIKETTKAERTATASAILALILCIMLIIYFALWYQQSDHRDKAPHDWNITRQMWLADTVDHTNSTLLFSPVDLVIIQHSVSPECFDFAACAAAMRNLQSYFINNLKYDDIGYNFQVANDGRVYEGRGWGVQGAHTLGYNRCSVGLGFIGDYRGSSKNTKVTAAQIESTHKLLEDGVKLGYLLPDYKVLGALDLKGTASPGANLYNEMLKWPHYDHHHLYYNKTCAEISMMIKKQEIT